MFVQPSYFHVGRKPRFPSTERRHHIIFPYAWMEKDEVIIDLPEGYELVHEDPPEKLNIGNLGMYQAYVMKLRFR